MTIKRSETVFIASKGKREDKRYCPICEKNKVKHFLNQRVYQDIELVYGQLPSDHDRWLQCFHCGNVFLKDQVRQEGKLSSSIQIPKVQFGLSATEEKIQKSKHQRGFNERLSVQGEIKDPEVRAAIKKGMKVINYDSTD